MAEDTTNKFKGLVHQFVVNDSGCLVDIDADDCRFVDTAQIYKRADSIIVHYSGARTGDFDAVPSPADGYNLMMAEYEPYIVRVSANGGGLQGTGCVRVMPVISINGEKAVAAKTAALAAKKEYGSYRINGVAKEVRFFNSEAEAAAGLNITISDSRNGGRAGGGGFDGAKVEQALVSLGARLEKATVDSNEAVKSLAARTEESFKEMARLQEEHDKRTAANIERAAEQAQANVSTLSATLNSFMQISTNMRLESNQSTKMQLALEAAERWRSVVRVVVVVGTEMHVAGVLGALDTWLSFALGGVVDLRALTNAPLSVQLHPAPPFFCYVGTIAVRWLHGDRSRSGWRCARIARRGDGGGGRVDGGDRWQLSTFEYEPPRERPPPEPPPILPQPEPPPERRAVSVTSALAGSASVRGVDPRSRCTNGTALAQLHRHWSTCANVGYGAMGLFGYGARTPLEWRHVDWSGSRATRVGTVVERTAASLTCWERTVSFSTTRSRLHRTRPFTATWIGDHAALSVSSLRVLAVAPRRG